MKSQKTFFSTVFAVLFLAPTCFSQQTYDRSQLADLFQNDDYEGAVTWLGSLGSLAGDPRYQTDLGYALYMKGDLNQSKAAFYPVLTREPGSLKANLYLARASEELDQRDSALFYYQQLTRLAPRNFRYWQKTTQLFNDMGVFDSALLFVRAGFDLNPGSGTLAVQYANALIRAKQLESADSLVSAFLLRDSANRDVIVKKIDIASKKSDHPEVIRWGEKLLKDSADLVLPFINLAYSYLNVDSITQSIYVCEWLIGNNKSYPQVLYCAALCYSRKKEFAKSNEYLDKCLKLSILDEAATYFNAKSDNYEEMKQYKIAADYHDTAYYIFRRPLDLYYAGRLYDKYLKNPAKAKSYYKQFLAKRKRPLSNEEVQIFRYINVYIAEDPAKETSKKKAL